MADDIAIKVERVSKDFILPHEKVTRVKDVFTSIFRSHVRTKEMQHALRDVSFEVKKGEFFGIVGRNGSGKSTMLKMLAGIYQPTKGKVHVNGKLVPFIELGVGFNPELTGRENVYLNGAMMGFSQRQTDAMYDDIVAFAELEDFMDQKLKNYSSGMQVRLAFSVAVKAEAEILLVDEVLAVGDADFQRKCYGYFRKLKKEKKTVIFVTHDMNAVREYCDRALLIDGSRVKGVGDSKMVSQEYSKLFIKRDIDTSVAGTNFRQRWGDGDVIYRDVDAKRVGGAIVITANIQAQKDTESVIYGLHVFTADGRELIATNNRLLLLPNISSLTRGQIAQLTWNIQNIFSDGEFFVTVTLVDSTERVLDWVNEIASFTVKRPERSTTPILPKITVEIQKK